jgi:hypothetical protein
LMEPCHSLLMETMSLRDWLVCLPHTFMFAQAKPQCNLALLYRDYRTTYSDRSLDIFCNRSRILQGNWSRLCPVMTVDSGKLFPWLRALSQSRRCRTSIQCTRQLK